MRVCQMMMFALTDAVGQSPGKRLMKIKVIIYGSTGGSLTRAGAWLRYAVIAVPTVLFGIAFIDVPAAYPVQYASMPVIWKLNGFVIFRWTFALGYLMIFNRRDRRSLQDFATSSVVVPVAVSGLAPRPMAKRHWAAMGVGAVVVGVGCMALNRWVSHLLVPYSESVLRAMSTVKGVRYSGVTVSNVRMARQSYQQTTITVGATDPGLVSEDGVREVANLAFRAAPELATQQFVAVVCQQRATLGIGSWTRGYSRALTPQQWATQAGVAVPGAGRG
ncbi:RDD family protein [Burkholderia sp. Bp8963]|uniref:RDD family protein n=1 Tax=Burkholderia sp. Bp8963 TaxID=2184547 RepID=UPI00163A41A8|nr:RDD family protein [Burkholderia sp. Bp8963]